MGERKKVILVPQYMKQFKCIGATCEDNCCIGWHVDVDCETYKKYQRVKNNELTPVLDKYVKKNRASTHTDSDYAKVILMPDLKCPFLNEDFLCKIQLNHGQEYLSNVCTTYPRSANIVNGVIERSATMSCPEMARLALLNPDIMEFDEEEEPSNTRNVIKTIMNTTDSKLSSKPQKLLWELRIFTITALQNRNYSLWQRMVILGLFYQTVQEYVDNKQVDSIPDIIERYTNLVDDSSLIEKLGTIPTDYIIQVKLLKEMADKRYFMGVTNQRYLECFSEFLNGLQYSAEATAEDIGKRYNAAYLEHYAPFMEINEYILENYLVNYVFGNFFPFTSRNSLFDSYVKMVLHYSIIKMYLVGMSVYHKGMTVELVIKLIQSFAKTVEHSQLYLDSIMELMQHNGFNTMAYMTILIKN